MWLLIGTGAETQLLATRKLMNSRQESQMGLYLSLSSISSSTSVGEVEVTVERRGAAVPCCCAVGGAGTTTGVVNDVGIADSIAGPTPEVPVISGAAARGPMFLDVCFDILFRSLWTHCATNKIYNLL
jgi:hypothetical protein